MTLIEDQTRINGRDCIKFVPRTTQATYLRFHSGSGCWSYVGKQAASGAQLISIKIPNSAGTSNCAYTGIVAHELTHALGFWHEQSRADRDSYIRINYANIDSSQAYNFDKMTSGVDTLGTPYDLYSIMHYEWNAFR
jgi:meprin B